MKRMHVHVAVDDLKQSIDFYSALFAARPSVAKMDYAKWILDDPRVNFAISTRGLQVGLDHLGIQVEDNSMRSTRGCTKPAATSSSRGKPAVVTPSPKKHGLTIHPASHGKRSSQRVKVLTMGTEAESAWRALRMRNRVARRRS